MRICDIDDVLNGIKNDRMVKRAIANRPYNTFFLRAEIVKVRVLTKLNNARLARPP